MFTIGRYTGQVEGRASQMAKVTLRQFQEGTTGFVARVKAFMDGDFAAFRKEVEGAKLSLFGKL